MNSEFIILLSIYIIAYHGLAITCSQQTDPNCLECGLSLIPNSTVNSSCVSCITNFYLPNPPQCQPCPENCDQCTGKICLKCKPNTYNVKGVCIPCNLTVTPITIDGIDYEGISNCSICQSLNVISALPKCLACDAGFSLNNHSNICMPCLLDKTNHSPVSGCSLCGPIEDNVQERNFCVACPENQYIDSSDPTSPKCVSKIQTLPENCLKMLTNGSCTSCTAGYYIVNNTDNPCEPCPSGCLTCLPPNSTHPKPICTTCDVNYWFHPKPNYQHCHFCAPNCTNCLNNTACEICNTGFYQDENLTCTACSQKFGEGCLTCTPNGDLCLSCSSDYILSPEGICIKGISLDKNCWINLDTQICLECEQGYYRDKGKKCQSCLDCIDEECNKCGVISTVTTIV